MILPRCDHQCTYRTYGYSYSHFYSLLKTLSPSNHTCIECILAFSFTFLDVILNSVVAVLYFIATLLLIALALILIAFLLLLEGFIVLIVFLLPIVCSTGDQNPSSYLTTCTLYMA